MKKKRFTDQAAPMVAQARLTLLPANEETADQIIRDIVEGYRSAAPHINQGYIHAS